MSRLIRCDERLFTKLEMNNPGGSHKYRAASHIVEQAVAAGEIVPGVTTVIEKTGGNFGFGLIAACHKYNVPVELAVGLGFSLAKRDLLECFGARLIGKHMLHEGATPKEVVQYHLEHQESLGIHYFYTDQFQNPLGVEAHRAMTGRELAEQLRAQEAGERILFVGCAGTGASFPPPLRKICISVQIKLACPPLSAHPVCHRIAGSRQACGSSSAKNPPRPRTSPRCSAPAGAARAAGWART